MATSPSQSSALQNQQGSLQALYNRFRDVLGGVFREVQMLACPSFAMKQPSRLFDSLPHCDCMSSVITRGS